MAYLQTYANDESRLDVTNATRFGVLALKFFQVEFFSSLLMLYANSIFISGIIEGFTSCLW